jgi:nucleotide-binding universal stress UspA family protein
MHHRILAAIDGGGTSVRAFEAAMQLAREYGAELQPLYVADVPLMAYDATGYDPGLVRDRLMDEGKRVIGEALAHMQRNNVRAISRIMETDPIVGDVDIAHGILHAAVDFKADLVVMGTHGRRGVRRFVLGSVAERFLRIARSPC